MGLLVKDVMQTGVRTVGSGLRLPELEDAFVKERVTGFPVVDDGRLVGVISRSDLVRQLVTQRTLEDYASTFYVDLSGFDPDSGAESLSELAERTGAKVERMTVSDLMTRASLSVAPDASLAEVAGLMRDRHVHRLPVTDGDELVGIISALDFVGLVADGRLVSS